MFSADLSWTDNNDEINKKKREQQQRTRAESRATQSSDSISVKSNKTRTSDREFRSKSKFSLFRSKSRNGESQRDIHSSAGSYMTNWTNGWSAPSTDGPQTPPLMSPIRSPPKSPAFGLAISPPVPAPNQFALNNHVAMHNQFVPYPLFSSGMGYSAYAEAERPRTNQAAFQGQHDIDARHEGYHSTYHQQPQFFQEPKTLRKIHSRPGPLRPPPSIPESPVLSYQQPNESRDQLSHHSNNKNDTNNNASVVKSVTVSVQYSATPKLNPLNQPKTWAQHVDVPAPQPPPRAPRCHEISGMASLSLAGKKCEVNIEGEGNHSARCFLNLFKAMKKADGAIALDFLRVQTGMGEVEELRLERMLWTSTLLLGGSKVLKALWVPGAEPVRTSFEKYDILDLDGDIGDLYLTSTHYPASQITHLTSLNTAKPQYLLPPSVTQTLITLSAITPTLPFMPSSMSLLTITRISSLLPAAQLPALLADCYRVLKPGGMLKMRLMDVTPDRGTAGPKLSEWIDTHAAETLETEFRCSRPSALVPKWVKAAGFEVDGERRMMVSAAMEQGVEDVTGSLGSVVCREMWKRTWGGFVSEDKGWWGESEVLEECVNFRTTWTVIALSAVKPKV